MTTTLKIPRTHIPKLFVLCPRCHGPALTIRSLPYADGYHRRHFCKACDLKFHSLSPYNGDPAIVQGPPFKDRELSEFEVNQRLQMWENAEEIEPHTIEIPFTEEVVIAIRSTAKSPRQLAIMAAVGMIEKLINSKYPKEGS